jgi:hypothetical protein
LVFKCDKTKQLPVEIVVLMKTFDKFFCFGSGWFEQSSTKRRGSIVLAQCGSHSFKEIIGSTRFPQAKCARLAFPFH